MTRRYALIVGGESDQCAALAARATAATGLPLAWSAGPLVILGEGVRPPDACWPIVIGDLFDGGDKAVTTDTPLRGIVGPAALVRDYWGRYLAIWLDAAERLQVLRDPSGALGCYYRTQNGVTIVGSDLAMIEQVGAAPRHLAWDEVRRTLASGGLRSPATAIEGVTELPPGTMLTVAGNGTTTHPVWSPWSFAPARSGKAADHAAALRSTIDRVVAALSGGHHNALATVSGGLDSSIIATSLARSVGALTCLTVATTDPSGDERRYARLVAEAAGATYRERGLDRGQVDLRRSQAAHLPRPVGRPFMQAMAAITAEEAELAGTRTIVNGTGGDQVFCFLQSATPVADRALVEGPHAALGTLLDMARMTDTSVLDVGRATLQRLLRFDRRFRWRADHRFLAAGHLASSAVAADHPWLAPPAGVPLGTAAHVAMLLRVQNYLDPWAPGNNLSIINPLLAQPVIEHCLSVPSWCWCDGGIDRAVARRAFADRLPAAVLARRWKGGPDSFIGALVEANRALITAMLLDGLLAERGIVDRSSIAAVLADPRPPSAGDALRLLALTDAEAWVRQPA